MRLKNVWLGSVILFAALLSTAQVSGQVKIGYTNIELILSVMPEAKQMELTMMTFQKTLAEKILVKEQYGTDKLEEYQAKMQAGGMSAAEQAQLEENLMNIQRDIEAASSNAEMQLAQKREELLTPLLERLQAAIDEVATNLGYTYILNQTTSSGVSTILYGPDEADVTEALARKLGIDLGE